MFTAGKLSHMTSRSVHSLSSRARAIRTLRACFAASATVFIAAASHAVAGGMVSWVAVFATVAVTLPVFLLLGARLASLWRQSVAVAFAQFVFHWLFVGVGLHSQTADVSAVGGSAAGSVALPLSPHAEHLAALQNFSPSLAQAGAADAVMWLAHAVAAAFTVVLLHRGELAAQTLLRLMRMLAAHSSLGRAKRLCGFSVYPKKPLVRPVVKIWQKMLQDLAQINALLRRGPPLRYVAF